MFLLENLYTEGLVIDYIEAGLKPFLKSMRNLDNQYLQYKNLVLEIPTTTADKPADLSTAVVKMEQTRSNLNTTPAVANLFFAMTIPTDTGEPNSHHDLFKAIIDTLVSILETITSKSHKIDWTQLDPDVVNSKLNVAVLSLVSHTIGTCWANR